jgi:hypothetical protein
MHSYLTPDNRIDQVKCENMLIFFYHISSSSQLIYDAVEAENGQNLPNHKNFKTQYYHLGEK